MPSDWTTKALRVLGGTLALALRLYTACGFSFPEHIEAPAAARKLPLGFYLVSFRGAGAPLLSGSYSLIARNGAAVTFGHIFAPSGFGIMYG